MTSAPAIGFEYHPSRWLTYALATATGLAVVATLLSGASLITRLSLSGLALACCIQGVRKLRPPIYAVVWGSHAGWTVRGLDGSDDAAILLSFRVMRQVVLLRLASHRYGKFTLWLTPDRVDADTRRRLRMRLAVLQGRQQDPSSA